MRGTMSIKVGRNGAQSDADGFWVADANASLAISMGQVAIRFRSGGKTRAAVWTVHIGTGSYQELADLMVGLSPKQAVKAFGKAIANAEIKHG